LFVVAGHFGPVMLVYPKIATKHGANHAAVTDFHCLLWPANLVQPCWFIYKPAIPGRINRSRRMVKIDHFGTATPVFQGDFRRMTDSSIL
jgi:hypothetical protein